MYLFCLCKTLLYSKFLCLYESYKETIGEVNTQISGLDLQIHQLMAMTCLFEVLIPFPLLSTWDLVSSL